MVRSTCENQGAFWAPFLLDFNKIREFGTYYAYNDIRLEVVSMMHKYIVRYVILILALLLCAGAAWYVTNFSGDSHGDAVLAYLEDPAIRTADEVLAYLEIKEETITAVYSVTEGEEAEVI